MGCPIWEELHQIQAKLDKCVKVVFSPQNFYCLVYWSNKTTSQCLLHGVITFINVWPRTKWSSERCWEENWLSPHHFCREVKSSHRADRHLQLWASCQVYWVEVEVFMSIFDICLNMRRIFHFQHSMFWQSLLTVWKAAMLIYRMREKDHCSYQWIASISGVKHSRSLTEHSSSTRYGEEPIVKWKSNRSNIIK